MNPVQEWKKLQNSSFLYKAVKLDQEESYWKKYAVNYDIRRHQGKGIEEELQIVLNLLTEDMSVLEIGAGTGIFTKHIAKKVKRVTVVEPSPSMIRVMKDNLEQKGIKNVRIIQSNWEEAEVGLHDMVLAAGCLYVFYDIDTALAKMIKKAKKLFVLTHGINGCGNIYKEAAELTGMEPVLSGPDYVHLYNVLCHMGIYANVNIIRSTGDIIYEDMDHAVNIWTERMGLIPLKEDKIQMLRGYLESRMKLLKSGRFSLGSYERINSTIWYAFNDSNSGEA
ncbi:MAG: class I SAM-dependent methyltransferase [Proteobacteria bacterium]|nr:class I SAM-dependent methyltransferase [Desulfobacula sp.]MBU3951250.1 class I SAM-dependent methyltransferase [Pseudomonadota bacterium]MBU4130486.1 class I SAM-dependent methyltransferase [Pseudomonadota bacterium]